MNRPRYASLIGSVVVSMPAIASAPPTPATCYEEFNTCDGGCGGSTVTVCEAGWREASTGRAVTLWDDAWLPCTEYSDTASGPCNVSVSGKVDSGCDAGSGGSGQCRYVDPGSGEEVFYIQVLVPEVFSGECITSGGQGG